MKLNQLEREYFKKWTEGRERASSIKVKNDKDMDKVNQIRMQETEDYEKWLMIKGLIKEQNRQYLREKDELHYGKRK